MFNPFKKLLSSLYSPINGSIISGVKKDADDAYNVLSRLFNYSPEKPEIRLARLPKIFYCIIDPFKGTIVYLVHEITGAYDRLRNKIYLSKEKLHDKFEKIPLIYHEMTHKFLERFNLPREVEEGYASWLTKKLTGYAKDAYGAFRNRFEGVYRKLGKNIFRPEYRNDIISEFYGQGLSYFP